MYRHLKKRLNAKRFVDVAKAFDKVRQIKDGGEIKRIKDANRITKRADNRGPEAIEGWCIGKAGCCGI